MKKTTGVGFYFSCVAAVLAVVAAGLYSQVMYKQTNVYIFLIGAAVVAVIFTVLHKVTNSADFTGILPVIIAPLIAFGAVYGAALMVNQIGYVIAGLDGIDTIMSFIIFEVVCCVALLVALISAFLSQTKEV